MAISTRKRPSMISLRLGAAGPDGKSSGGRELVVEVGVTDNPKRLAFRLGIERRDESK